MKWNIEENFTLEWMIFVWNGYKMKENCQDGMWKNRLSFHTMPSLHVL